MLLFAGIDRSKNILSYKILNPTLSLVHFNCQLDITDNHLGRGS